jgi:hypothetical protein
MGRQTSTTLDRILIAVLLGVGIRPGHLRDSMLTAHAGVRRIFGRSGESHGRHGPSATH